MASTIDAGLERTNGDRSSAIADSFLKRYVGGVSKKHCSSISRPLILPLCLQYLISVSVGKIDEPPPTSPRPIHSRMFGIFSGSCTDRIFAE